MADRRDLPLFAWGDALRAARRHRIRLRRRAALVGIGIACLGATIVAPPAPRLVWNASASAPVGLYAITPGAPIAAGDLVLVRLPGDVAAFAARRHYLPLNVPAVKYVGAAGGDTVCTFGATVAIAGRGSVQRRRADRLGRPLPWFQDCRQLGTAELLLLNPARPDSFDGRYFGITDTRAVVGKAVPLWVR
ncbi:S26 family signal peptidase [Sphingomonas sp. DT-204]|uniref:S26 family signal peptidase n=1 Tax=Sphingomonas sp. DT-204 TaxID=3396166 RepID=UPI003F1DFF4B